MCFLRRKAIWVALLGVTLLSAPATVSALTTEEATSAALAATTSIQAVGTTETTIDCSECHGPVTAGTHHETDYYLQGQCNFCHEGVVPGGDCSGCHTTLGGLENPHHAAGADCSACHSGVGDLGDCLPCHSGKIQAQHHLAASNTGIACNSCHATLQTGSGCADCHGNGTIMDRHHAQAALANLDCASCHPGSVDILNGCYQCHDSSTAATHHTLGAAPPYNLTCTDCHTFIWDKKLNVYVYDPPSIERCITCHETVVGNTTVSEQHHLMSLPAEGCIGCHAGLQPDVTCDSCHGDDTAVFHHGLPAAISGECTVCHVGANPEGIVCANCHTPESVAHHAQPQATSGDCTYCHSTIELQGGASCQGCHTGPVADIHHGQPLIDVGGDCSACHESVSSPAVCANCHAASPHHSTTYSQSGNCTHCHQVPAEQAETPKQAACRECHGVNKHGKATNSVQDFGACQACHHVDPYHAKPATNPGYTGMPVGADGTPSGKGMFNIFWSVFGHKAGMDIYPNGDDMGDNNGADQWKDPVLNFGWARIEHDGQPFTVPTFDVPAGVTVDPLEVCGSCHSSTRASQVSCNNPAWLDHLSQNRVELAVYRLAEATYIGSLCSNTLPTENCTDGIDNDGDGLIDCSDTDCDGAIVCQISPEVCSDGIDNDLDGLADCDDPDCTADPACQPQVEICYDGTDNDGDGQTDCDDSDCNSDAACQPPTSDNLALSAVDIWASSTSNNYGAGNAADGNDTTRWYTSDGSRESLYVDLGSSKAVDRVVIKWHSNYATEYYVRYSDDNDSWNEAYGTSNGNGGTDEISFSSVNARYWRLYCRDDANNGFSVYEFEIYGSSSTPTIEVCDDGVDNDFDGQVDCNDTDCSNDAACQPQPEPEVCYDTIDNDLDGFTDCNDPDCDADPSCRPPADNGNLALYTSASATDDEGSSYRASNAVDGNIGTSWWSRSSDDEWLTINLGQNYTISKVVIKWTTNYAEEYEVHVRRDSGRWRRVADEESGRGGTETITFSPREADEVRVTCKKAQWDGYQITELEVYK